MHLKNISLTNFKNIAEARLELSPKFNCFLGDNGMGKSNLLDAVYYLSFCKSFTGVPDALMVKRDEEFMMMAAQYLRKGVDEDLQVGIQRGKRKTFKRGGKEYQRLSAHIGLFPLVLVAPADMTLVDGASEERRRFMDQVISQTDARYLDMLIRYNKALEQRNTMLRTDQRDHNLYEAVEMTMDMASRYIVGARRRWVETLSGIFNTYYSAIGADGEAASLVYKTHLDGESASLSDLLDHNRDRDRLLKHTSVGPHRDDIEMTLSGMPVRRTASQGQAKTYVVSLRLAQYEFLCKATGMKPILLLDDIFDKLDARRVEKIISVVGGDTFGQIFITDTHRKHIDEILVRASGGQYALWHVADGVFNKNDEA